MTKTVHHSKSPKDTKNLEQLFKSILSFLRSRPVSKTNEQKLISLPWFLVIGQPESGKTELLAGAEQKYIFSKKNSLNNNKQCSWWVTNEAVYLNIPGRMMLPNDNKKKNFEWLKLVKLLKKHQHVCTIQGVLIVLDSHDILTRSDVSNHFRSSQLAQSLTDLNQLAQREIPIHLILNKCDLIPGFLSFFEDQGKEFRQQSWGFKLSEDDVLTKEGDSDNIDTEFSCLIKQLNKQLLWHLHHEPNENKRLLIKAFPLQLEHLKLKLTETLNGLKKHLANSSFMFKSIFLCSSTQYDTIDAALASDTSNAIAEINHQNDAYKRYFTYHMFSQIVHSQQHPITPPKRWQSRGLQIATLSGCAVITIATAVYLAKEFSSNINSFSKASSALGHYQEKLSNQQVTDISGAIDVLNDLSTANQYIDGEEPLITRLIFSNNKAIKHSISNTQEYALYNVFIPALKQHLSSYLNTHDNNPAQLYIGLKIYLMLGHQIPMNKAYIEAHLSQLFSTQENNAYLSKDATNLLLMALDQNDKPITLDQGLISEIQGKLNHLQPTELAYIILYSDVSHEDIDIQTVIDPQDSLFTIDPSVQHIPAIYTANEFKQVFPTLLDKAVNAVINGNEILGIPKTKRSISSNQLNSSLRNSYLKEYANTWVNLIEHIELKPTHSFSTLASNTKTLSSMNSPILAFISTVRDNTNFPEILQSNTNLSAFTALLDNLSDPKESQLFQIFSAISDLSHAANNIAHAHNDSNAFEEAKQILNGHSPDQTVLGKLSNLSQGSPQPISNWLQQIAGMYWTLLLDQAGSYINQQWHDQVSSAFNSNLANKFPFNPSAKEQVDLTSFNQFFNKKGLLESFEENYIFPFISYSNSNWQVKPAVAQVLTIPGKTLEALKRLAHIQAMYFTHNGKSAYTDFSLQPLSADTDIQSFKVIFGKEEIVYNPNIPNAATELEWPSNTGNKITIEVTDEAGRHIEKTLDQPWDWPKLVAESSSFPLEITDKTFELTLDIEGHKATFNLANKGNNNPFALNYIQTTSAPSTIFETHR